MNASYLVFLKILIFSYILVCQPYTYCCNSVYKVAKCIDYKYCGCVGPDTVDCTHFFEQDCYTFGIVICVNFSSKIHV